MGMWKGDGLASLLVLAAVGPLRTRGHAQASGTPRSSSPERSKPASVPSRTAFFGELHLHTSYSLDSYIFGNRNDPETAYRFGQGEAVTLSGGKQKRLTRPLDFVAVTDHAEWLGEIDVCTVAGNASYETKTCERMRRNEAGVWKASERRHRPELCGDDGSRCRDAAKGAWKRLQAAAAAAYKPGKFTTLVGYEYSPILGDRPGAIPGMLHRNVIFRTDQVPENVFSSFDGTGEQLQQWFEVNCREPCRALTIPHNSNYSWGRFFWDKNSDGSPWTKEILERRARIEPLIEIFQTKGSSECMAGVGLSDEEYGFENTVPACPPGQTDWCAGPPAFVRDGLVRGLAVDAQWGVNPFKYGIIGATDTHAGLPGSTEEKDWPGIAHGVTDNTPEKLLGKAAATATPRGDGDGGVAMTQFNPGGLAGVWAETNTREAIWDALYRRETFGTSGTRIRVRFFGSFDFPKDLHKNPDLVKIGYEKGVPMGGDLRAAAQAKAPTFVAWATRDPDSAPLQKIQIVKGWIADGKNMERVYDVVCSDGILPDPKTGVCRDNGATVDLASCTPSPGKGAGELSVTWTDPAFEPKQRAVDYARVLEDPVCRWSTHDALALHLDPPKGPPPTVKERAWTSPIWYTPAAASR
ncbi:MAG: DUF3604 domain-containing protein [Candidatus Binatia bacterium]